MGNKIQRNQVDIFGEDSNCNEYEKKMSKLQLSNSETDKHKWLKSNKVIRQNIV